MRILKDGFGFCCLLLVARKHSLVFSGMGGGATARGNSGVWLDMRLGGESVGLMLLQFFHTHSILNIWLCGMEYRERC